MRVLHATAYFAPAYCYGGPPRSIWNLCRGLQDAGVQIQVFSTTANGTADFTASPPEGEQYQDVPVRYFRRAFPRRFFGAAGLQEALETSGRNYDLIHVHGLWNVTVWTVIRYARRHGIPYVISPRGMLEAGAVAHRGTQKRIVYELLERKNLENASLLHATSENEARTLAGYGLGVPIVYLPNPITELDGRHPPSKHFRRRLGLAPNAPLIVFLGRIHRIKRLDLLASAFQHVRHAHPDANLVIAGPDEGGYREKIVPKFGHNEAFVHWVGEIDTEMKWSLLAEANGLVMCSDSESFGMSVAEAMAAGVPVIVTRTCPWDEIVKVGSGFWVAQDAISIAAAINKVLNNPSQAKEMGERGKALIRDKYSLGAISRALVDHYAAITRRPGGVRVRPS